ncbi:MAG: helix-turn-helix domain-containing protein [Planctomycetota bacterium]
MRLGNCVPRQTSVGRLLTRARLARGWTQDQVAACLDATRQHINNIEAGRSGVRAAHLWTLCRVLKIDPGKLLRALERDYLDD